MYQSSLKEMITKYVNTCDKNYRRKIPLNSSVNH